MSSKSQDDYNDWYQDNEIDLKITYLSSHTSAHGLSDWTERDYKDFYSFVIDKYLHKGD